MLKEAETTDQTGIVYLREDMGSSTGVVLGGTLNLFNPMFSRTRTEEVTRPEPDVKPELPQSFLAYSLLSTGRELREIHIVFAPIPIITDYRVIFDFKNHMQTKPQTTHIDQILSSDTNSASFQAERLREISGLTIERLAEIFDVSRTTYHKWISGSPLRDAHREQLLEVLSLIEEAAQRLGGPNTTSTWLLTPVSPGGMKPIDYLAAREYSIFRGFLLRVRTGQEMFRPLTPSNRIYKERSPEEIKDALERLRPRAWRNDEEMDPSDTVDKDL